MTTDVLTEALDRLDLPTVARSLGLDIKPGAQRSPFRKDKSPSFSVYDGARRWKDHATSEGGGCWDFMLKARPEMPKKDIARYLIQLAGLDPNRDRMTKQQFRQFKSDQRQAAFAERRRSVLSPSTGCRPPDAWPDCVHTRWRQGIWTARTKAAALNEARGYTDAAEWLIRHDLLSRPTLPWSQKHGWAFAVQAPAYSGTQISLTSVGYHQRFIIREKDKSQVRKAWIYCPHKPREPASDYQAALASAGRTCPALPFILGNPNTARALVIVEGQWDAIALWEASGWFRTPSPPPVCVFGMRGSQSINEFFGHWTRWLRAVQPRILLWPDNDIPGSAWYNKEMSRQIEEKFTFYERLKALGLVVHVVHTPKEHGKDFNDFYRSAKPSESWMHRQFTSLQLIQEPKPSMRVKHERSE